MTDVLRFWLFVLMMVGFVGLVFLAIRIIPNHAPHEGEFAPKTHLGAWVSVGAMIILVCLMIASFVF